MNYYNLVTDLCRSQNISLARLEKDLEIGNGTIGKWRESTAKPSLRTLEKISDYFNIPVSELVKEGSK